VRSTGALGRAAEHRHLGRQSRHHDDRGGCVGAPGNSLPGTVFAHLSSEDNPAAEPPGAALLLCSGKPETPAARIAGFEAPPAPGQAVIGSQVKLTFEAPPARGPKVPEWQVI
jgi:hypothetical protein